jgi:hypothetical protein
LSTNQFRSAPYGDEIQLILGILGQLKAVLEQGDETQITWRGQAPNDSAPHQLRS